VALFDGFYVPAPKDRLTRSTMPLSAALLETFHAIVSDNGFITDKGEMAPFLEESRNRFESSADLVLKPKTTQEVAEILSICNDNDIPVVPQGGNTGHCGGAVSDGGVLLNLSRLNKIRHVDPANASLTVEAGCILQDVQKAADEHNLLFPLSLAAEGSCQIGGNLATNAGGIHVLKYGNMRDLTLGLEVCLPDGRIWDGLRLLRKDNTGYDLKHLFIGSEGTLGVITAASLKLFPKPKQKSSAFIACERINDLLDIFDKARACFGEMIYAFEIMPSFAMELVTKHIPDQKSPFAQTYPWYGLIELVSTTEQHPLQEELESFLSLLYDDSFIHNAILAQDMKQANAFLNLRESISAAQKKEGGSIKHDVSVPLSAIPTFMEETTQACQNLVAGCRVCAFGHMGDGNIHFNISRPEQMESYPFLKYWEEFNELVHDMVHKFNGSISAEHGIGKLKMDEMERYLPAVEIDMMRNLKRSLDPNNIMNPNKIIRL
jgi:FAD/FMN-containing dehydrogenase